MTDLVSFVLRCPVVLCLCVRRRRLDIPALRTLFGLKARPHHNRKSGPPAQDIVIEKPQYGLSWFRIRFGRLQLKAYTKGEHVLRFEATVHNTKELRCRRSLEHFSEIITLLAGMADRFAATLDCADIGFLPDGMLDQLPLPAQIGARRIAGIDLNKPRIRAALSAALALAPAPGGFTAAEHAAKVRAGGLEQHPVPQNVNRHVLARPPRADRIQHRRHAAGGRRPGQRPGNLDGVDAIHRAGVQQVVPDGPPAERRDRRALAFAGQGGLPADLAEERPDRRRRQLSDVARDPYLRVQPGLRLTEGSI